LKSNGGKKSEVFFKLAGGWLGSFASPNFESLKLDCYYLFALLSNIFSPTLEVGMSWKCENLMPGSAS
jgi:hypothetical protein